MIGIGLDAVDINRFRATVERQPGLIERVFTEQERADMAKREDPMPGFAARFAVREAVMKAMGLGFGDVTFRDIEVMRAESGKPDLKLSGTVAKIASQQGISTWRISITHTDSLAMAVVAAL